MDVVAYAEQIQPIVRSRAREIEEARRFPADLAGAMAEAGLFRMAVPRSLGGLEVEAAALLRTFELIGEADASAGWCVMIGATSALVTAYLPPAVARNICSTPTTIMGGGFAPLGRAVREGDHYRLSGRWPWASGGVNCHWLMGGSLILEDGKPRPLGNGMLDNRMLIFPAAEATLIDSWFVSGLCGTGSGEMEVTDIRVPVARSLSLLIDKPVEPGPLYTLPVFGLLALGIGAVMLGNARAAVTELIVLAGGKTPQGSSRRLAERGTAQAALAEADAQLRAARAFFYDAVGDAWRSATRHGAIPLEQRATLRLAATHATRVSANVTRSMYDLGGGSSVYLSSPLQRRFRDAHAGTQHAMVGPSTWELAGRVLMGLPTDLTQL